MKKKIFISIVCMLLFSACGKTELKNETDASVNSPFETVSDTKDVGETEVDESVYDNRLLEEYISEEGTYIDEWDNAYDYSYKAARIKEDTLGAKSINQAIAADIESCINDEMIAMNNKASIWVIDISYKSYWNGSVLSLFYEMQTDFDANIYRVYNYDFAKHKCVSNDELLELAGISEKDFEYLVPKISARAFDNGFSEISADYYYEWMAEYRARTINKQDKLEDALLFLDDDGKLEMELTMYIPAGSGEASLFEVISDDIVKKDISVNDDLISVKMSGGLCTITISSDVMAYCAYDRDINTDLLNKPIEVHGLYNDYEEIYIGLTGESYYPYLIFLTENGTLEYVDVFNCLVAEYFCACPLPYSEKIIDVVCEPKENYGEYQTIYAVDEKGNRHDVLDIVLMAYNYLPYMMNTGDVTWTSQEVNHPTQGGGYSGIYSLYFDTENSELQMYDITPDAGITLDYAGNYSCLGMSDCGLIYVYRLYDEEFELAYAGSFAVDCAEYGTLKITNLGGSRLFDMDMGECLLFTETMG